MRQCRHRVTLGSISAVKGVAGFTFLAVRATPSRWAEAAVAVDFVHAGGAEEAGRRLALVDV